MCPVSPVVLFMSPPLLALSASPSRIPWCCVDFSGGPVVCCQHLSKMLQLSCFIPVADVFSILDPVLYYKMFSFSLPLFTLSAPVSLSFLSFTWLWT